MFDTRARAGESLDVLQKDYALSYVLAGIASVPELYEIALFKGGTCLRKAYFEAYRFSIDLDYTLQRRLSCDRIKDYLIAAAAHAQSLLQERGDFAVEVRDVPHLKDHEHGQCEFKVAVRFPWMRAVSNCVLKIELLPAPPEVIIGSPVDRDLMHVGFGETLPVKMRCYELREIVAEKLRGFVQTRRRFDQLAAGERTFARSRPRDLFDLTQLHQQTAYPLDWPSVRGFIEPKAAAYGITIKGPDDFLDARVLDDMQRTWDGQLGEFIKPLPSFTDCLAIHKDLLSQVFA